MRRILFVSMTVALVSFLIVPSVFAAKFKVPKEACYSLSSEAQDPPSPLDGESLILAFKLSGLKVKIASGTKKFYTLQGILTEGGGNDYEVMNGAGYIVDGEDYFRGEFSGTLSEGIIHCQYAFTEGAWMNCKLSGDGFTETQVYYLNEVEEGCKGIANIY